MEWFNGKGNGKNAIIVTFDAKEIETSKIYTLALNSTERLDFKFWCFWVIKFDYIVIEFYQ